MAPRIIKSLIGLSVLFVCAAAGPPESALVKDAAAAIAIGKDKCLQTRAAALRHDWTGKDWRASFDPASGYWWVSKYISFSPPDGGHVMGLRVLVNARSGDQMSCDLEYIAEY